MRFCLRIELGEKEALCKDRAREKEVLCKDRTRRKGGFV